MAESIMTGPASPVPIRFPPLLPLCGTWEPTAETAVEDLAATSLDPADEESGLLISGTVALGGIGPGAMGGVGRVIESESLLEDPVGV